MFNLAAGADSSSMTLSICTAQLNFVVGDMPGNAQKIIAAAREAHAQGARLLLTPELAICGYAAEDLFLRPAFLAACDDAVKTVARETAGLNGLAIVLGHPQKLAASDPAFSPCLNAASVLRHGRIEQTYAKHELPNYQVFDERRYFVAGRSPCVFEVEGVRVGLLICEDAWFPEPARAAAQAGAQLLAVVNASPFHLGKSAEREQTMRERVAETGLPLVYAHLVGGQDEVVFEGRSFALNADGTVAGRAPGFKEKLVFVQTRQAQEAIKIEAEVVPDHSLEADLWDALVLAIAVDALGADKVRTVMMPSPYTADISWIDARDMAERMGVRYDEISIALQFEAFKSALAPQFAGRAEDTTE